MLEPPVRKMVLISLARVRASLSKRCTVMTTRSMECAIASSKSCRVKRNWAQSPRLSIAACVVGSVVSSILACSTAMAMVWPCRALMISNEAVHQIPAFGLVPDLSQLPQNVPLVELVDPMPGGQLMIMVGGQVALAVRGKTAKTQMRHHALEAEQPIEVGATDVDAAVGKNVGAALTCPAPFR